MEASKRPFVAARRPKKVDLEAGTHHWCSCGLSQKQPFCDGSHRGTGLNPLRFTVDETGSKHLCRCTYTQSPPYCDGAHRSLPDDARDAPASQNADAAPPPNNTPQEPPVELIHTLAREGLSSMGHHGPVAAMGVPRGLLPSWDDIQIVTAQLARFFVAATTLVQVLTRACGHHHVRDRRACSRIGGAANPPESSASRRSFHARRARASTLRNLFPRRRLLASARLRLARPGSGRSGTSRGSGTPGSAKAALRGPSRGRGRAGGPRASSSCRLRRPAGPYRTLLA